MSNKIWDTNGYHHKVNTHVVIDDEVIATREDYDSLSKSIDEFQRHDFEPKTLDFSASQAPHIYKKAQEIVEEANKTFKFQLTRWQQELRFNNYGVGKEFKLHNDYAENDNSKLAFVHMVEEPLEGGELLLLSSPSAMKFKLKKSQTIIFPSYLMHQVMPIIAGQRLVLVGWATGRQFT